MRVSWVLMVPLAFNPVSIPARQEPGAVLNDRTFLRVLSIRRSTNRNVLVYEVKVTPTGFETPNPLHIYWEMEEKEGRYEAPSSFELRWAYGVNLISASDNEIIFTLKSLPKKPITVSLTFDDGSPRVETTLLINGQRCYLDQVYVNVAEGGLIPRIHFVEVQGETATNRERVLERVFPK